MAPDKFDNEKTQAMRKFASIDKSKKGSVDQEIMPILDIINSSPDYYTTSSCSGRVLVIVLASGRRKDMSSWPYVTHSLASAKEVVRSIRSAGKGEVWLKQEAAIIHVACRDLHAAQRLLDIVRYAGFKRAGIIGARRRIMLEIIGTDAVAIPLGKSHDLNVDEDYIRYAVSCCNNRMRSNRLKLKKLFNHLADTNLRNSVEKSTVF